MATDPEASNSHQTSTETASLAPSIALPGNQQMVMGPECLSCVAQVCHFKIIQLEIIWRLSCVAQVCQQKVIHPEGVVRTLPLRLDICPSLAQVCRWTVIHPRVLYCSFLASLPPGPARFLPGQVCLPPGLARPRVASRRCLVMRCWPRPPPPPIVAHKCSPR